MPSTLTSLKIFIASPGGLADERRAFREEIDEYNNAEAISRGVLFRAVGWEDTLGAVGRPQSIINDDLRGCDYFLLVLWNRWGSPPDPNLSRFSSGTEEEYNIALQCFHDSTRPIRQLVLMFKAVELQQMADPGPQLKDVLNFRARIESEKSLLFHAFDTTQRFRKLLRQHLAAWLREEETREHSGSPVTGTSPISDALSERRTVLDVEPPHGYDPTLTAAAWALANEGRLTEAEVEFAKLAVSGREPDLLTEYARFLIRVGRVDQAVVILQQSSALATAQNDEGALSRALRWLGNVRLKRFDLDGAEEMYRKALAIDEKLARLDGMADNYADLGIVLERRFDLDGAEEMYRKALTINQKLGRLEGVAGSYRDLGGVLERRSDLDSAEDMYRKALAIAEKLGRPDGLADTYGDIGIVLDGRSDPDGAEEMYRKALAIDEKLGRLDEMATNYVGLGNVRLMRSDLDGAEEMYRKALTISEKLGRPDGLADIYGDIGIVLEARSDLDGAEEMYRKALAVNEKVGRLEGLADNYGGLGNVRLTRSDLDGAEEMYRKALVINEKLPRPDGMAENYAGLGDLLEQRSDFDGAEEMYRKALAIDERLGRLGRISDTYERLGNVLDRRERKMHRKARALRSATRQAKRRNVPKRDS